MSRGQWRRKKRITVKDIALRAGSDHSTVSRSLRDDPWISPRTRNRIKELAEEMGYIPSAAARELGGGRSRMIGICLSDLPDPALVADLQEIGALARDRGLKLLIAFARTAEAGGPHALPVKRFRRSARARVYRGFGRRRETECLQDFLERRAEGILLFAPPDGRNLTPDATPIVTVDEGFGPPEQAMKAAFEALLRAIESADGPLR